MSTSHADTSSGWKGPLNIIPYYVVGATRYNRCDVEKSAYVRRSGNPLVEFAFRARRHLLHIYRSYLMHTIVNFSNRK